VVIKVGKVVINPIIGPVVVFSLLLLILLFVYMPKISIANQKITIEQEAKSLIAQLKSFRSYYTHNVIDKVVDTQHIAMNFDHEGHNQTIPLPATTLHNLSDILTSKEQERAFKFYSDHPFPNRANRRLDSFQKEAIAYLRDNPHKTYAREDKRNGEAIYRVALADIFDSQACVHCHNSRADSPKHDWQVGDVRGVFEVDRKLGKNFMLSSHQVNTLLGSIVLLLLFALTHYSVVYLRRGKEMQEQADTLEREVEKRTMDLMSANKLLLEYKKAVDASAIVSKTDRQGRITYVNDAFCNISGYSLEELLGKSHNIVRCHKIPSSFYAKMWETINNKEIFKGTIRNQSKSGDIYYVASTIVPILDRNNEIVEFLSLRFDVTDLEVAKKKLEIANKHLKESIEYASMIQSGFIPEEKLFAKHFQEYFTIWEPKDIVGGDIYLFEELRDGDESLLFVIDCTGHGVHGAFVSMIVKAIERHIVARINYDESEVVSPANLLGVFNRSMKHLLKQDRDNSLSNAGFDGQILYYNKKEKIIKCASARSEIFYLQEGTLHRIKGDRHSVGYRDSDAEYQFSDTVIDVSKPTILYIFSDGYIDQVGGPKRISFGKKRLQKIIEEIHDQPLSVQKDILLHKLKLYQDRADRLDDITFIACKVDES